MYVSKLIGEIEFCGTHTDNYKLANKLNEEVIDGNITLSSKFELRGPKMILKQCS